MWLSLFSLVCWTPNAVAQWQELNVTGDKPRPRIGHSMVTYTDDGGHDIVVMFGGRSQFFASCAYNNNWNYSLCGDHFDAKLVDTSIVLASSDPLYPRCALNCSGNGWCHYDQTVSDSYCICYDEYRGPNCQYKEFQNFEYDIWFLNMTTLYWTQYDFLDRSDYAYADDWPWPTGRFEHSAIIRATQHQMVIYGGYSPKCLDYCNDIWAWNFSAIGANKWSLLSFNNNQTDKLWQHAAFLSHDASFMYVIAGHSGGNQAYSIDVKQFNLDSLQWTTMNYSYNQVLPPTRIAHASSAHFMNSSIYPRSNENNVAYIHGGYHAEYDAPDNSELLRYLWSVQVDEVNGTVHWQNITYLNLTETDPIDEIQTELNRWYKVPFPRMDHTLMHVPGTQYLLLFGGYSTGAWFNDTWRFDLNTQIWTPHTPSQYNATSIRSIPRRSSHAWAYLPSTHSIVLFGGYGNDNIQLSFTPHSYFYNDVWALHLNGCPGYEDNNECHKNEEHGSCLLQFCVCNDGFYGTGCEYETCPGSDCVFNNHTLQTQCTLCNGHGTCTNSQCSCYTGFTGDGCGELQCANDCHGHGECVQISSSEVRCECYDGFEGDDCGLHSCPNNCTNRGTCDTSTGVCHCQSPEEAGRAFSMPDCVRTILISPAALYNVDAQRLIVTTLSYNVLFTYLTRS